MHRVKIITLLITFVLSVTILKSKADPETNSTNRYSVDDITCEMLTNSPDCVKLGKKFYLINPQHLLNWFQADRFCRQQNARLALIENDAEMDAIVAYISKKEFFDSGFWKYWLGASDLGSPGTFYELESGKTLQFARWGAGQPDKWEGNPENCLNLLRWLSDEYTMNDEVCTNNLSLICEFNIKHLTNGGVCSENWKVEIVRRDNRNDISCKANYIL